MSRHASFSSLQIPSRYSIWNDGFPSPIEDPGVSYTRPVLCSRTLSSNSGVSTGSVIVRPLRVRNQNIPPSRKPSLRVSHKSSWGTDIPLPPRPGDNASFDEGVDDLEDIDLGAACGVSEVASGAHGEDALGYSHYQKFSFVLEKENTLIDTSVDEQLHNEDDDDDKVHPFRRWMSTLHRKNVKRRISLKRREERWALDDSDANQSTTAILTPDPGRRGHQKSSSWSSSGFVTAVKSASASLAAISAAAPPSRRTRRSTLIRSSKRSSRLSSSFNGSSAEDRPLSLQVIDEAALHRAIQRRSTLEELVSSEESYVADLKVLVNVYFTLLASAPTVTHRNISHIHDNITEILVLHEDILVRVRRIFQRSEGVNTYTVNQPGLKCMGHSKWHSRDEGTKNGNRYLHNARNSLEVTRNRYLPQDGSLSEPEVAAQVAAVFDELMSRFFVYEEYGARYESMLYDMTSTSKMIPNWQAYERGIEALANTLAPTSCRNGTSRKGLTFGDLLIKPIQRVCKYPLLFADLLKYTPVIDCPESHTEVEKVLYRLRETAMEINRATNDRSTRDRIQRSWYLQDLLVFPDPITSPFTLRTLGHSIVCGVLHVAYQSKYSVLGRYMLCALFKSCLILGVPSEGGRTYTIVASISLSDLRIHPTDDGNGLQCHTALYSWKIVFESDQQLFELIMSACSVQEEQPWRSQLLRLSAVESQAILQDLTIAPARYSMLSIEVKPIGNVLGQPGTLARHISVQRAATVGPRTTVCQVIIKHTHALRDGMDQNNPAYQSVSRSRSLLSTNRIPVLAPRRVERIRMEHDLCKVWTKDLLPYPGMSGTRGERLIQASKNSVMRKLSRASIASGLSKRSTSIASMTTSKFGDATESLSSVTEDENGNYGSIKSGSTTTVTINQENTLGETSLRRMAPPSRTSSAKGTRTKAALVEPEGELKRSSSEEVAEFINPEVKDDRDKSTKVRWSSPFALIRTLSTEGLKGFRS